VTDRPISTKAKNYSRLTESIGNHLAVTRNYEAILPRLRPGGQIAADNTLWSGKVLDPKEQSDHAIVAFNTYVARDSRVEQVLLPVRDGVMLIRKK